MASGILVIKDPTMTIPADVFGLDGFLRWVHSDDFPEGRRASFLAGEVNLEMSAEELVTHNYVKADTSRDRMPSSAPRWRKEREALSAMASPYHLCNL